jgi:hypothetical protein
LWVFSFHWLEVLSLKILSQGSNVGVDSRGTVDYCVEGWKPHAFRLSGQEWSICGSPHDKAKTIEKEDYSTTLLFQNPDLKWIFTDTGQSLFKSMWNSPFSLMMSQNILDLQVLHGTLNPIWDETFHFLVEDARQDMLRVQVWNDDTFGRVVPHP